MERRDFLFSAAGSFAALNSDILSNSKTSVITKLDARKKEKTVVSILQSEFSPVPPEGNMYHPKFDPKILISQVYEKNIENICQLLEEAGKRGSDIACTTEDIKGMYDTLMNYQRPELFIDNCETIPGKLSDKFGEIAKKYNMYIISCFFEKENGNYFNTAVLIDRKGKVIGKYRKVQLPAPETWILKAGDDFPVFETDFGKVGIQICYDMIFPEISRILSLNGADIIFTPTGGYGWTEDLGTASLKVRAADNGVWIAMAKSASVHGPGRSAIVNPLGQIIADAGYDLNTVLTGYIDPKETWIQPDYGFGTAITGVANMRARLNMERRPEIYKTITDKNPKVLLKYPNDKLISGNDKNAQKKVVDKLIKQWKKDLQDTEPRIGLNKTIL